MCVGVGWAYWEQVKHSRQWEQMIRDTGVAQAIESLVEVTNTLVVEDVLSLATLQYQTAAGPVGRSEYLSFIREGVRTVTVTNSIPALARYALRLEDLILVDRLSVGFLQRRRQWRDLVLRLHTHQGTVVYMYTCRCHPSCVISLCMGLRVPQERGVRAWAGVLPDIPQRGPGRHHRVQPRDRRDGGGPQEQRAVCTLHTGIEDAATERR